MKYADDNLEWHDENELVRRLDVVEAVLNLADTIDDVIDVIMSVPTYTDRPQGEWAKTDIATYRCSECGKIQIADDVNELNYCCCCGSRNKVRRAKGADDE